MFGKLKEKLKGWFKSSKEKIEEKIEESEETKPEERLYKKADKLVEKTKEEVGERVPIKLDITRGIYKPDLEKVKEEAEHLKKIIEKSKKEEKEIKKFEEELESVDKLIELAKHKEIPEVPVQFDVGKKKFEPDLKQLKIEEVKEEKLEKKPGFLSKLKSAFIYKITEEEFNEIFEELENLLLENNVALEAVDDIKLNLSKKLIGKEIKSQNLESEIRNELKKTLNELLIEPDNPLDIIRISKKPFKILFFGINGTGKTTSIAKIAYFLKKAGFSLVLAAGDTFRAASIEQISEHAKKLKVPLVKQNYGADPAAVGFDAIKYAEKNKIDVVLIDTAGRMHTKTNLLSEMEKIARVTKPDLKLFVAESIAGNDAVEQARTFHEKIEIDGTILSKADIDEKGGTIISISHATKKPIFYLGTGQKYEDLELFNKQKFIESLLG
ncbi:MAG: signal recognition particle-docking protein FtsY [Nanoarchaeota archaeon]